MTKLCYAANSSVVHVGRWVTAFAQRGYDVHVVSMPPSRSTSPPGAVLHTLPFPPPLGYWANAPWLRSVLRRVKPDILHVHYAAGYGVLGRLSGFHPRILSVWGSDVLRVPHRSAFLRGVIRKNLNSYDHLCATGTAIADEVRSLCPEAKRIHMTPFGVDTALFQPDQSLRDSTYITVGTVKKLHPFCGIDVLVRAFAEVKSRFADSDAARLRLWVIGVGPEHTRLQTLAQELGIAGSVSFLGSVDHTRIPRYLNQLDVYICPSRVEGFGVAVLEASACGIPVVVTNVGGLPEVVEDGKTGFIVPPEDPNAIADAVETLVRSPELRRQMGQAGREMVARRYDWNDSVRIMEDVYAKVLASARNAKALHGG